VKCQYCGKDEAIPFKCQYCQGFFCAEHRLPENHACPMAEKARAPREEAQQFEYKVTYTPPLSARFSFSPTEIRHLIVSALLVMGVGLSLFRRSSPPKDPVMLSVLALLFASIFLMHEMAHKLVAQHYGLWAEFRLFLLGALLTLISVVSPIKFIAPGAVVIAGPAEKDVVGKTSIAGPLTNIVLSSISFVIGSLLSAVSSVAMLSAAFNAWIALFNLIPVAMLDGLKVLNWNKIVWGLAFALAVVLTALTINYVL
jgi:Zn-dependent protease